MRLYLVMRTDPIDYDQFKAAVVASESEEDAKSISPDDNPDTTFWIDGRNWNDSWDWIQGHWKPEVLSVTYIGEAKEGTERGVILGSFRAG